MNLFDYNKKPTPHMLAQMENLRGRFKILSLAIKTGVPNSRERSLAITKLEEAAFWLNKAITHTEESVEHEEVVPVPANDNVGENL